MATLVLSAAGAAFGGPMGSAIGAMAGRQIDAAIFGGGSSEGARLTELAASTSSYGQSINRHHGTVRVPGTIIWATDLQESRESSGGKGKPKVINFGYSSSLAVAISSRPIVGIGRIWADGNLLRGSAGDLKTGGSLRVYNGYSDQPVDPLIAASEGAECPAFRGFAYVVFEDLQLADFGSRVPALTFEVFADGGIFDLAGMIEPIVPDIESDLAFSELAGFTIAGGPIRQTLSIIDQFYPINCETGEHRLSLNAARNRDETPIALPESVSGGEDGDFGKFGGFSRQRIPNDANRPDGVRYYDTARDYLPGLQHAAGRAESGENQIIEFPGTLAAEGAQRLANGAAQRANWMRERLFWRIAEIDPRLSPGAIVTAPGVAGQWRIAGWEWRERGVELELLRLPPVAPSSGIADSGQPWSPLDDQSWATWLEAFELPWDGRGSSETPALFAAASAGGPGWNGAALYTNRDSELIPVGNTGPSRSTVGMLNAVLAGSQFHLLEQQGTIDVDTVAPDKGFAPATIPALANGANRLLVGSEIVQFASAEQLGETHWRLTGLLRGRAGTEDVAQSGHAIGTRVVLLDDNLVNLGPSEVISAPNTVVSAIGYGDEEPVSATLTNSGATLRPLSPVHPIACLLIDGSMELHWTRRARGAWDWPDEVGTPLIEQAESYIIGLGPVSAPLLTWLASAPTLGFSPSEWAALQLAHPGADLWVRQIGSHAQSDPLLLAKLAG